MKNSIDFLPERKQRDLHELVRLIRDEVKDVVMVILYGSYAKNTYVECDERRDFGVKTFYISDYDLLVVTKRRLGERESTINTRIKDRFLYGKDAEFHTRPQIINESISKLNNAISECWYFYVDILEQGVMLYDSGEYELVTPRDLNYAEIKEMAQKYFDNKFIIASDFLDGALYYYDKRKYKMASFNLHQAAENYLKTVRLVYSLYGHKEHDLEFLLGKCKLHTLELAKVFPRDTEEEERLFELLKRAYVEARYNDDFIVTKSDIDALTPKVEQLRDITDRICKEQIARYEEQNRK
ncbi:HEPN domain-containing protein [Alistipes sp. AF48-12]|uniref:HEPN domain-containing protein n=1 Tax=Alistipes sp. AF48-12 TaxID=2291998 RepID=UPI000E47AF52|nr:HEPN domain-containing protein [Alistipes sp. AF48-12]RHO66363.1 HEPN domain-containing protein [Alistipes sp. AF48-12]